MHRSVRFFHATAMVGRLHLLDIGDWGSWDPARIDLVEQEYVDAISADMGAREVRTVEELDVSLQDSQGKPGSITLYFREDLLDAARERWQRMRENRSRPL